MSVGQAGTGYWSGTGWVEGTPPQSYQDEVNSKLGSLGLGPMYGKNPSPASYLGPAGVGPQPGDEEAFALGVPHSEIGDYYNDPNYVIPKSIFPEFNQFGGRSASDIAKEEKARALKVYQNGQMSNLTSYAFDPETTSGVKKAYDNFQLSLNEIMNEPWSSNGTKNDTIKSLVNGVADSFAQPFKSVQDFQSAYNNDQEIRKNLDEYLKAGGSLNDIATKIQNKNVPQGWDAQTYANFKKANPTLEPTAEDTALMQNAGKPNNQSLTEYLGLNDGSTNAVQADKSLLVEGELAKNEIARQYNIPNDLMKLYFGDDQQIGLLKQKQQIEEEKIKLIEKKVQNSQQSARAKAEYEIAKNESEVEISKSTIEENRLNAKNYMTGMLAKLGALQTTGAAPVALSTLDQKYFQQKTQLESKLRIANQGIRLNLEKDVNDVETNGEELIQSIKEDLSKDQETIFKEIMKAKDTAEARVYTLTSKYAGDFANEKSKYEKQAKTDAEKYIKDFSKIAGKGYDAATTAAILSGQMQDPTNASGQYSTLQGLPSDVQDTVVEAILQGTTLTQLATQFPNISRSVLNGIWNQMTNKNTGTAVKPTKGETYSQLASGKWKVTQPDGTSYVSDTDPRQGGSVPITSSENDL